MPKKRANYAVYYPRSQFDLGQRFFFFTSLFDKPHPHGRNQKSGADLASEVVEVLAGDTLGGQNLTEIMEGGTIINQAMNFLKNTIEQERKNEQEYFSKHITNSKLPEEIKQELSNCFNSDGSVDYLKFISLINVYYIGMENFKKELTYESARLDELTKYMSMFKATKAFLEKEKKASLYGYADDIEEDRNKFYEDFNDFLKYRIMFEKKHGISGAKSVIGSKTITNQIQEKFKSIYYNAWNNDSFRTNLIKFIQSNSIDLEEIQAYASITIAGLISAQTNEIRDIILSQLTYEEEKEGTNKIDKIVNLIVDELDDFNNAEKTGKGKETYVLKRLKVIKNHIMHIQQDEQAFLRSWKRFTKKAPISAIKSYEKGDNGALQSGISIGSQALLNEMEPYIIELEDYISQKDSKLSSIIENNRKLEDGKSKKGLKARLTYAIRRKISQDTGKKMKDISYKEIEAEIKNYFAPLNLVIVELTGKNERALSELRGAVNIGTAIANSQYTQSLIKENYIKSDNAIIEIGQIKLTPNLSDSDIKKITDQLMKNYINNEDNYQAIIRDELNNIIYDDLKFRHQKVRGKKPLQSHEFSIKSETNRRLIADQTYYKNLKKQLEQDGKTADEINSILNDLKNTFKISTTIKEYDKYDNDLGFFGGSLGGSLEHQINNLYDMMNYGGITLPDYQWLMLAIYNCSNGTVGGEALKNILEDFFSSFAVMLLFDDAGQQAEYIKTQAYNNITTASNKALHLYILNGFYFPASFILELTYNSLAKGQEILNNTIHLSNLSNGSRLHIINNVSEDNMVTSKNGVVGGPHDWGHTVSANASSIQLQLTFLAGFLDILEKIEDAMTTIGT